MKKKMLQNDNLLWNKTKLPEEFILFILFLFTKFMG